MTIPRDSQISDAKTRRAFILQALLVGATLGSTEAVWGLSTRPGLAVGEIALLLLYGCAGPAIAACVVATAIAWGSRVISAGAARVRVWTMADAIAVAVSTVGSIHLISALIRLGRPDLAWLIPGCVFSAIALGFAARWLAGQVALVRSAVTWLALNLTLLAAGLFLAGLRAQWAPVLQYTLATLALLALGPMALVWRRQSASKALPFTNALALAAIACMPMLVTALPRAATVPARAGATPPNVLLISVDTLRADRLGCYGSTAARTPHIDELAQEGALFEQAVSAVPLTGPSHITMLTGLYHTRHGAQSNGLPIRNDVPTVADVLSHEGYRTAAFVSGWTLKTEATKLAARFDRYDEDFSPHRWLPDAVLGLALPRLAVNTVSFGGYKVERVDRVGATTTTHALEWLAQHRDRPFFVLAHYFDPHAPYAPPPPYDRLYDPDYAGPHPRFNYFVGEAQWARILSSPRDLEHYQALYNGEVSYADAQVGRLLDGLAELGLSDNTLVIFTSDHGESLTEHGFFFDHGEFLYDTCVHVPLIIRFPDRRYAHTRHAAQVRLADLTPTILDALGVHAGPVFDGRSVLPVLVGSEVPGERPSFGWIPPVETHEEMHRSRYAVRTHGYKLIWNFDVRHQHPAYEELYDLRSDPGEEHNLIPTAPEALGSLRDQLAAWREAKPVPPQSQSPPSQDVKERLRALGY